MNKIFTNSVMKLLVPFILLFLMLFDGQLSNMLRHVTDNTIYFNSHLFLIGLIISSLYFDKRYVMIVSLVLGAIFDWHYYNIIGINIVVLPLTVLFIYVVFKYVKPTIFTLLMSLVVFITVMDGTAYLLQVIFKLTNPAFQKFITNNIGPTLIMNIAICILFSYPINKLIEKRSHD